MTTSPPEEAKTVLTIASPSCVADEFGDEIVALNLDTGFYFSLRGLASAIWRDLAAGHPREDVAAALGAVEPTLRGTAETFIDELVDRGLMRRSEDKVVPSRAPISGPLAAGGATELVLESFDDMRELVVADPIHEVVEEVGWPARKASQA